MIVHSELYMWTYIYRLRISGAVMSDTGEYKCVGSNLNGTKEVTATVTILPGIIL